VNGQLIKQLPHVGAARRDIAGQPHKAGAERRNRHDAGEPGIVIRQRGELFKLRVAGNDGPRRAVLTALKTGDLGVERTGTERPNVIVKVQLRHAARSGERHGEHHIRVILDTARTGRELDAVGQPSVAGIGVRAIRHDIRLIGKRHFERENPLRQRMDAEFRNRRGPELARPGQIVAQIGARRREEHASAVGFRGDRRGHRRTATADHDHIRIADHRHGTRALHHGFRSLRQTRHSQTHGCQANFHHQTPPADYLTL